MEALVPMSVRLDAYLALERVMLVLDETGDSVDPFPSWSRPFLGGRN